MYHIKSVWENTKLYIFFKEALLATDNVYIEYVINILRAVNDHSLCLKIICHRFVIFICFYYYFQAYTKIVYLILY